MKKFLALVLALVMTMSLVTISAGAEDFTDADAITYEEAVEVMTAIGVVGGYADGSFNPTAGLTRGAAAKIICNMLLGPTTAEALVANEAPYSDVAVDNVFAGYIAFCANEGIISGYADGTFKPAAPLTGYAFMKMLLGALGYDAVNENYVGNNWSIQVAKRALAIGLDAGLVGDFAGTKALTREEACLYAFNALTADMVKYDNDSKITVGDIVISNSSKAVVEEKSGVGYDVGDVDSAENPDVDSTLQFCEQYFKNLKKATASADAFGRPADYRWFIDEDKDNTVDTDEDFFTVYKTPVASYNTEVKGGKVFADLGKPETIGTVNVIVNGKPATSATKAAVKAVLAVDDKTALKTGTDAALTGNGVVTEVYDMGSDNYTFVVVNTFVGTIGNWVKANVDTDGDIIAKEYVEVTADSSVKPGTLANSGKFETTAFAQADEDDATVVLYTAAYSDGSYVVKTVAVAEKVENLTVSKYSSTAVVAGGAEYKYNLKNAGVTSYTMDGGDTTYTLYLDGEGYVIYNETYTAAASTDYVMITAMTGNNAATYALGDGTVETAYRNVKYVDMTGAQTVVKVANDATDDRAEDTAGNALVTTKIYTVKEDEDNAGYYKFVAVDTASNTASALNKTQPTVATGIVANAETVFVLKTAADPVAYKIVTGIANVPAYTGVSATAYAKLGDDTYADVVFLDVVTNGTPASSSTDDVIYLLTKVSDAYDAELEKAYDIYEAVVKGELTTVKVADEQDMSSLINKLVEVKQLNADGFMMASSSYTAAVSTGAGTSYIVADSSIDKEVKFSAPTLTIVDVATYTMADDAVVYMIDADDELTVGKAADFVCANANGKITVERASSTDNTVVAIYFDGTITE